MKLALLLSSLLLFAGATRSALAPSPVPLVASVDLPRYMGDWYLIAHIPTSRDRAAHNAVENYRLNADGSIATTYTNRVGGFDGRHKKMTPLCTVVPGSNNALWSVRFDVPGTAIPWPVQYEYRIGHLEPDYSVTIIARSKLDYVWLFSREPTMSDAQLARYTGIIGDWGYDTSLLLRVPQQWPAGKH